MIRLPPYRPATSRPIWDYQLDIGGVVVRIRLVYRARIEGWLVSVWADGEALIEGRRLVEGNPLLWRHRWHTLPPGRLALYDLSGAHAELATEEGLGWTHCLYWIDPADQTAPTALLLAIGLTP